MQKFTKKSPLLISALYFTILAAMMTPSLMFAEELFSNHHANDIIHHSGSQSLSIQLRDKMGTRWYQQIEEEARYSPRYRLPPPIYRMPYAAQAPQRQLSYKYKPNKPQARYYPLHFD